MEIKQEYVSTPELARLAGVVDVRIRQLILAGKIPATKFAGRWLITREDALEWLDYRRQNQNKAPKRGEK